MSSTEISIPFPTTTNPGRAPGEGSGRVVNCLAYQDAGAARWRPLAGLSPFATLPPGEIRGALDSEGLLTVVAGQNAYQVDAGAGVLQLEQQVPGDGPVTISRNNAPVPDVCIVTSAGGFVIENGVVKPYPPAPLPSASETFTNLPSVNSVATLDGYLLLTTPGGQMYASDLNSTNINALSFATAEARPDGLLRGVAYGSQYFAMGEDTIEVWQDAGTLPFPLARVTVIPQGLLGPWAVAGWQDGWAGPLIYVAQDYTVRMLDGYTPQRVSSEDLERLIAEVDDVTTLRANVYTIGGASIFSLSSPDWTWELNVTTGFWHERVGYGGGRWRGDMCVSAFGGWVIADQDGGELYLLDPDARLDGNDPIVWGLDSGPVKQFPARIQCPGAAFDFVLGAEDVPGVDPQVMLSWSHDGGGTWANPLQRSLHRQGFYGGRVSIDRIGLTQPQGVRFQFRASDPTYSSFSGGMMNGEVRR